MKSREKPATQAAPQQQPDRPAPPSPSELLRLCGSEPPLIAFDFDGTLAAIASRPEWVRLPEEIRDALARASFKHKLLICSGRAIADLKKFLPERSALDLIGNHGAEWWVMGQHRDRTAEGWTQWRDEFLQSVRPMLENHGGEVEDKRGSISVHYRHSQNPDWWNRPETCSQLEQMAGQAARLVSGISAWNFLPAGISKGEAILSYVQEFNQKHAIYFGDEPTDESVYEHVRWSVKIGNGPTLAKYRLADVQSVHEWVLQLSMLESGLT